MNRVIRIGKGSAVGSRVPIDFSARTERQARAAAAVIQHAAVVLALGWVVQTIGRFKRIPRVEAINDLITRYGELGLGDKGRDKAFWPDDLLDGPSRFGRGH